MVDFLLSRRVLIWIKAHAHAHEKGQHPHCHKWRTKGCNMHDVMGNVGMLRGWVSIWTTQMMWFVATMIVAVGVTAMAELLVTGRVRRAQAKGPMLHASAADTRSR
jgi:hypothetical protein